MTVHLITASTIKCTVTKTINVNLSLETYKFDAIESLANALCYVGLMIS